MDDAIEPGPGNSGPTDEALALEFPNLSRWTYLNHAAISPWPESVRRAVRNFTDSNVLDGPERYARWLANEQDLRERYARLINATSAIEISLVSNTTEGIALVANGLDWRAGDNVVTAAGEFPSNQMPWAAVEQQGVSLRVVDLRDTDSPERALLNAMDERTRVLTVSAVQWNDGLRLQLEQLGPACRAAGVLFFVDAIQQLGALRMDVEACAIDCLAAGGHKWQMAPEGQGLFYCAEAWRERLRPLMHGWRMLEKPYDFLRENRMTAANGKRFEPGTPNTMGQHALNAALELQERFGQEWIEQRVLANTDALLSGLEDISSVSVTSPQVSSQRSGIVSMQPQRLSASNMARQLKEQHVVAVARGDLVRISPHFYQGTTVIDHALEVIEAVSR